MTLYYFRSPRVQSAWVILDQALLAPVQKMTVVTD